MNGRWYTSEKNCLTKKDAEQSAAHKACTDLTGSNLDSDTREYSRGDSVEVDNDSSKHMPPEYADIEQFLVTMLAAFDGRIRKVRPPNARGQYRIEIGGNYRYCENIKKQHKKNQVYFLVDPIQKVYYQKCYDPDCQGFQSAKQKIYTNQQVDNSTCKHINVPFVYNFCLVFQVHNCDMNTSVGVTIFDNQENLIVIE